MDNKAADIQNIIEGDFHRKRKAVYKKISRPVVYDGITYESCRALAKFLGLAGSSGISRLIKNGEYRGKTLHYAK